MAEKDILEKGGRFYLPLFASYRRSAFHYTIRLANIFDRMYILSWFWIFSNATSDYLNEGSFDNRRNQKIVHAEALCEMMEALTGDVRFTDQAEELLKPVDLALSV